PFLEEAYKQVPESIQVRLLLAVQHLRHHEWVAADEALRQAEQMARERNAADLLAHAGFFRRSLILMRTIGHIDQELVREQVNALRSHWLISSRGGREGPVQRDQEPVESLPSRLPAAAAWDPRADEGALVGAAAPVAGILEAGELQPAEPGDTGLFLRTV